MKLEVILTGEANQNLRAAYEWYRERSPEVAERWYAKISEVIASLENDPIRCALANENGQVPIELRQLNFGSGRKITHRIVFAIRPTSVVIYAIRHVGQRDWESGGHES